MQTKWIVLALVALMYALVIAFQKHKLLVSTGAAFAVLVLALVFSGRVFPSAEEGAAIPLTLALRKRLEHCLFVSINWNVVLIFAGSMMLAKAFVFSGLPMRIAGLLAVSCKNPSLALLSPLLLSALLSMFVQNVATVLVVAPVVLALCERAKVSPSPFLVATACVANLEGTATLVGDPPSMIFAGYGGYGFNDFFIFGGKPSVFFFVQAGTLAGFVFLYFALARKSRPASSMVLGSPTVRGIFPAVLIFAMVALLALLSFFPALPQILGGIGTLLLGASAMLWFKIKSGSSFPKLLAEVRALDWESVGFLAGVFVVMDALSASGLLENFAGILSGLCKGSPALAFVLLLVVSLASGFIDNVPFILTMLPVARSMSLSLGSEGELLMFALFIGSCFGGNMTIFGASANVAATGIAQKAGERISFFAWMKFAVPFTLLSTTAAAVALWLCWG